MCFFSPNADVLAPSRAGFDCDCFPSYVVRVFESDEEQTSRVSAIICALFPGSRVGCGPRTSSKKDLPVRDRQSGELT
jgi:hypothetical protein